MMSEHNGKHDYDGIGTPLELGKEPPTFSDEDLAGIVLGRPDPAICLNWRSRRSGSSGNSLTMLNVLKGGSTNKVHRWLLLVRPQPEPMKAQNLLTYDLMSIWSGNTARPLPAEQISRRKLC